MCRAQQLFSIEHDPEIFWPALLVLPAPLVLAVFEAVLRRSFELVAIGSSTLRAQADIRLPRRFG